MENIRQKGETQRNVSGCGEATLKEQRGKGKEDNWRLEREIKRGHVWRDREREREVKFSYKNKSELKMSLK